MRRYGDTCDLSGPLAGLSDALEQAGALGLYRNSTVVAAQAVYDGLLIQSLDCAGIAAAVPQVNDMTARVQALVAAATPVGAFHVGPDANPLPVVGLVAGGLGLAAVLWWGLRR
jgi:hypothetical protein